MTSREGGRAAVATAAGVLVVAVALYVTGLSRAVGVVMAGVATVLLLGGVWTLRRGRGPHRGLLVGFAVVVAGLVAIGLVTWLYALSTPSNSV